MTVSTEPDAVVQSPGRAESVSYRFFMIAPFMVPDDSLYSYAKPSHLPREQRLMNYELLGHHRLLRDVEWQLHPGPRAPYGDWMVENREEFALVGAAVLPIVREACESGNWDAVILLGGGEPGVQPAREIAKRHGIPLVTVGAAQMHVACMLGHRFSIIDVADSHRMHYADHVAVHRMDHRCASIRIIDFPLPRPGYEDDRSLKLEMDKALSGEASTAVTEAVDAAEAAIEEDGADVVTFGCSLLFWLQPFVRDGLRERGWDVPVLEGFSCAFTQAKTMVDLGVDASALIFPPDRPARTRRKELF